MINVTGATLVGVGAVAINVEVDLLRRLPAVVVVGLPAPSVRESADRVRSAILGAGCEFPKQRAVISLSPADLRKDSTGLDLPMAIGVLVASGRLNEDRAKEYLMVGELSLGGELRQVRGILAFAELAKKEGMKGILVPEQCAGEAALVPGIEVRGASTLASVIEFLSGTRDLPISSPIAVQPAGSNAMDLKDVVAQPEARLALEVAAAGGHNLLFEGSPGCGKSMLASRLPSILPPMTHEEALECTRIQSVAGLRTPGGGLAGSRPFRAPHFSISIAGLVGGATLRPGEVTLAHNGVLFLDELPEFPKAQLELLRLPLQDGQMTVQTGHGPVRLPAHFQLVAASNPCPCGFLGHAVRPCVCSEDLKARYARRLAGPLLNRFDLKVRIQALRPDEILSKDCGESSAVVQRRVMLAREMQRKRGLGLNAQLTLKQVVSTVRAGAGVMTYLENQQEFVPDKSFSARVSLRLLRVARTLADLSQAATVCLEDVLQAETLVNTVESVESV